MHNQTVCPLAWNTECDWMVQNVSNTYIFKTYAKLQSNIVSILVTPCFSSVFEYIFSKFHVSTWVVYPLHFLGGHDPSLTAGKKHVCSQVGVSLGTNWAPTGIQLAAQGIQAPSDRHTTPGRSPKDAMVALDSRGSHESLRTRRKSRKERMLKRPAPWPQGTGGWQTIYH